MTTFVIQAWLMARLEVNAIAEGVNGIRKQQVPIPLDGDDNRLHMNKKGAQLILGRGGSSDQTGHVAIPESSGFGTTMPSRALVLALKQSRTGSPDLTAVSEPTAADGWQLRIGKKEIPAGSSPQLVAAGETVTLQYEIDNGDWVDVLAVHIDSAQTRPGEDSRPDPVTDPAPISVFRDEMARQVHTYLFGDAPENWHDWAKAIAALTVLYQRPHLFNAYPHLKLASRLNWIDAVTQGMGRTQTDAPKYATPKDILGRLSRPLSEHNYKFDEVFALSPWTSTDTGVWLKELTTLLVRRAIVTEDVFEAITPAFAAADELEKNRSAERERKRREKDQR